MATLGGKSNVVDVLACATSRLRLELNSQVTLDEAELKKLGVTHVMKINDRIVHLLLGNSAAETGQAMKALLV
ncbi:MAG: PTS transporter subunit EIIB [Reinekea sp.]|nr:PTS transporter subunit EIIB [Reinekea sp.]MDX1472610.1 PTS transporter subunit EIIB [Reinekea sp.]